MKNTISLIHAALIVSVLFVMSGCDYRAKAESHAEESLQDYVAQLYPEWTIVGFNIMELDGDGDGYVDVDVRIKNPANGEGKMLALSCAIFGNINSGCKARAIGTNQN